MILRKNGLEKQDAKEVLNVCLETGGDFAELYFEDRTSNNLEYSEGDLDSISTKRVHGCGIRILKGFEEMYGFTNDCSKEALIKLAHELAAGFSGEPLNLEFELQEVENPNRFAP